MRRLRPWTTSLLCSSALWAGCSQNAPPTSNASTTHALNCVSPMPQASDVVRFLEQASFGPTPGLVQTVQCQGYSGWIADQIALPPSLYDIGNNVGTNGHDQVLFYTHALTAPDQLRQRVALALSEIVVVSAVKLKLADAVANHQNILLRDAWGPKSGGGALTYKDLLYDVSIGPGMGHYLDMVNNDKPKNGSAPNENYARELMQLFSIGLNQLNPNGTPTTTPATPTYGQDDVEAVAHIMTGWTYAPIPPATAQWTDPPYYDAPMVAINNHHDTSPQTVLGVPYTSSGDTATDLATVIGIIYGYKPAVAGAVANVAPFISKQLIQHLVTSNPSHAYVRRVTNVFASTSGDLAQVVPAILLDDEARLPASYNPPVAYGHLREPVLYLGNLLRLLAYTRTDSGLPGQGLDSYAATMGQSIFYSPSVFNYFPPDYPLPGQPAGSTLSAPEFALENNATAYARDNFVNQLLYLHLTGNSTITLPGASDPLVPVTDIASLISWLNTYLLHGTMSAGLQGQLNTALMALPGSFGATHIKRGIYLTATSAEYKMER